MLTTLSSLELRCWYLPISGGVGFLISITLSLTSHPEIGGEKIWVKLTLTKSGHRTPSSLSLRNELTGWIGGCRSTMPALALSFPRGTICTCKPSAETYPVRPLAAPLQPDAGPRGHLPGGKLHAVVAPDPDRAIADLGLGRRAAVGRQQGADVAHQLEVSAPAVSGGGYDEVDVQDLVVPVVAGVQRADPEAERRSGAAVAVAADEADDVRGVADAVRPPGLVGAQLAPLLVHELVQVLDQPEAHDAVVGRPRVRQQRAPVRRRPREQRVHEGRVEDGVHAVRPSSGVVGCMVSKKAQSNFYLLFGKTGIRHVII